MLSLLRFLPINFIELKYLLGYNYKPFALFIFYFQLVLLFLCSVLPTFTYFRDLTLLHTHLFLMCMLIFFLSVENCLIREFEEGILELLYLTPISFKLILFFRLIILYLCLILPVVSFGIILFYFNYLIINFAFCFILLLNAYTICLLSFFTSAITLTWTNKQFIYPFLMLLGYLPHYNLSIWFVTQYELTFDNNFFLIVCELKYIILVNIIYTCLFIPITKLLIKNNIIF